MNKSLFHLGLKLAIWRDDGKVLILWRQKDVGSHWDLPGGCIHDDEIVADALRREVLEEMGPIIYSPPEPVALVRTPFKPFANGAGLILWYHRCRAVDLTPLTLSDEHQSFEWLPWDLALPKLTSRGDDMPDLRL